MRGNTIQIELPLKRGKVSKTIPLYQYDYGQNLVITGAELPEAYEVHFANEMHGEAVTAIGGETGVLIPDSVLASGEPVYLWLYLHEDSTDGETEFQGIIPVIKRASISDQEPTPAEQSAITQAIAALNSAVTATQAAQDAAEAAQAHIEDMGVDAVTLQTGESASVTKSVSSQGEVTLTFGLPRGEKGDRGDSGEPGEPGNPGADGEDGFSPVVSLTKSGTETTLSITDATGTSTVTIEDGEPGDPTELIDDTAGEGDTDLTWSADKIVGELEVKYEKPSAGIPATDLADGVIPDPEDLIDDTAGDGDTDKVWSADKSHELLTEITNAQDDLADPVGFLEINDLDAEIGGKVNTLKVPYEMTDLINNSIILSNGTIRTNGTSSDTSKMVSPLVEVVSGKTYGLKIDKRSTVGDIAYSTNYGYGLYESDGTTPVSRSAQNSLGNDIYLFTIPSSAKYIRFTLTKGSNDDTNVNEVLTHFNKWILLPDADNTIDDSFFVLGEKKADGEISEIYRRDGSKLVIADEEARTKASEIDSLPITFGRRTCAIFEKVCCIGDSFTAGYIYNSSGTPHTNNKYSWVEHLKNMTGRDYVNCGKSGATTASWLTDADGLAKAQIPANKAQAYIIALQINDAAQGLTVGTVSDIGTENQTYIGCTSKIMDEMFTINDDAHIFLLTQPKNYVSDHTPYRQAILDIVEWYQTTGNGTHQNQVHLIDLLDYWKLFRNPGCHDSSANGHYTAVGWEYTAEILMYAWSNYLNAHPLLFQDVNLIPFGST